MLGLAASYRGTMQPGISKVKTDTLLKLYIYIESALNLLHDAVAVSLSSYTFSSSIFLSGVGVTNPSAGMQYKLLSLYYQLNFPISYLCGYCFLLILICVHFQHKKTKIYIYAKTYFLYRHMNELDVSIL